MSALYCCSRRAKCGARGKSPDIRGEDRSQPCARQAKWFRDLSRNQNERCHIPAHIGTWSI